MSAAQDAQAPGGAFIHEAVLDQIIVGEIGASRAGGAPNLWRKEMRFPEELKYTKTHEWVLMRGEIAVVGITDFAQQELTDVVYVELPSVGKEVKAGEDCAVVESVKAAVDIYAPLSGKIVGVNEKLSDEPQLLNSDPYGEGWVFEMQPSDMSELDALMDAQQYQKTVEEG